MEDNNNLMDEVLDEEQTEVEPVLEEEQEDSQKINHQILAKMNEERLEALKKIEELERKVESMRKKLSNQQPTPAEIREQIAREHSESIKEHEHDQQQAQLDLQEELDWEERIDERIDQIKETTTKLTENATQQFDQFKHKASDSVDTLNQKMEEDPQTTIKQILAGILMLIGLFTLIRNLFK